MKEFFNRLGKSLMQPVAVLPLAALLLGIGYAIDPTDWGANSQVAAFLIKSGGAVLDNLGILFAVGVAFGMSKDSHGAASLAGLVSFLTFTTLLNPNTASMLKHVDLEAWTEADPVAVKAFSAIGNGNAFFGIMAGVIGGMAYNKFYQVKLPDFLAFFSGRRAVPIITSLISMLVSLLSLFIWPAVYGLLVKMGDSFTSLGAVGAGIYGFFNRLLIPTGLHHALNQVFWFDLIGINDIPNFLKNTQEAITATYHPGMYQAGFFPVMMFGLPAAALAMYQTAYPEQKKEAGSILLAGALASFATGVTEPLEFSFMFIAPQLYLVHAALTGVSVFLAAKLGWYAGFGFSAGLVDYALSLRNPMGEGAIKLLILGLIFAAIYYLVFKTLIVKQDIHTPGRSVEIATNEGKTLSKDTDYAKMAAKILEGVGGADNISSSDYCITRIRLEIKDYTLVNEKKIKAAGAAGVIRPSQKSVQVVIGPQVQAVYDEFKELLNK